MTYRELVKTKEAIEEFIENRKRVIAELEERATPRSISDLAKFKLELEEAEKKLQQIEEQIEQMLEEGEKIREEYMKKYNKYTETKQKAEEEITKLVEELMKACTKWKKELMKTLPSSAKADQYHAKTGEHLPLVPHPYNFIKSLLKPIQPWKV